VQARGQPEAAEGLRAQTLPPPSVDAGGGSRHLLGMAWSAGPSPEVHAAPGAERLLALHDAHHARLEELLYATIEAAVLLEGERATASLQTFAAELAEGLALEDALLLPIYARLGPQEGPGRLAHVEGDHTILLRGLDAASAALAQALTEATAAKRRPVLAMLPLLYRLLGTLEHHTERERRHVYPVVAPALSDDGCAAACARLTALVRPSPAS
jgi:hypothetical protein